MEQFLAILNELSAAALAEPSTAALIGGGAALVLILLMVLGQSGGLRRLRKALEVERQSRVKLNEAVDSSGQKLEALRNEFAQYHERLAQLESGKQSQASRIDELSDKLNAQQNINSQLEQRLAQADALLKEQNTQLNNQLTQYQFLLDSARQTNDTRTAELGRQLEQLNQKLAALREPMQSPPLPRAAAEATPAPVPEVKLEQHSTPVENLGEQLAGVEQHVSQPNATAASSAAAIAPSPQVAMASEPEAPVAEYQAPVAEPAKPATSHAEPEPVKAAAKKGLFDLFGKKTAAPEQRQTRQEKPAAVAAVPESMRENPAEPKPVKSGAKKGVFGLFGKKTTAPEQPQASQEKPAAFAAAPKPTAAPEPAREAQPAKAEAKPGLFGGFAGKSAPAQAEAPAPARKPEVNEPEKETVTKALLSFMADDLKKGTDQLKGLFKFGGKK